MSYMCFCIGFVIGNCAAATNRLMNYDDDDDDNNNNNEQQLFLETRNGNIRCSGKPSTPKPEGGYCNEATQSRPLTVKATKPKIQDN